MLLKAGPEALTADVIEGLILVGVLFEAATSISDGLYRGLLACSGGTRPLAARVSPTAAGASMLVGLPRGPDAVVGSGGSCTLPSLRLALGVDAAIMLLGCI